MCSLRTLIFIFLFISFFSCREKPKSETSMEEPALVSAEASDDLKIIPIAHGSLLIQYGNTHIYVDPVGPIAQYDGQADPDLILITDIHGDHFSLETLEALPTSKAKIIVPQAVAAKMPEVFTPQIEVLNNGESKERFGINVAAIPMYNLREEALGFHPKNRGNGYVLQLDEKRVYISGDTEDIPEMRALENIDIAIVCMNLPYTMTVESAASAVLDFAPKQVYPYHYRGRPDVSDVAAFKEMVYSGNPDIEVIQLDWYPNEDY
ncbi:MAG: MBL fold metallo-hydrolase [Bacteroidia bacterium]|nr:MBL fold metallo-hydrolase [Bacteroidia bacterium]